MKRSNDYRYHFCMAAILFLLFVITSNGYSLDCPPPPEQFARDISAKGRGEMKGALSKLISGKLSGDISIKVQNLMKEYPNADKLFVIQGIMSMYCQIINESTTWSDNEKLKALDQMNSKLLPFMYQPSRDQSKKDMPQFKYNIREEENEVSIINSGGKYYNLNLEEYPIITWFAIKCGISGTAIGSNVRPDWKHVGIYKSSQETHKQNTGQSFQYILKDGKLINTGKLIKKKDLNNAAAVIYFRKNDQYRRKWFEMLGKELHKSNLCLSSVKYSVAVKFSYEDSSGRTHYRRLHAKNIFYPSTKQKGYYEIEEINESRFSKFVKQNKNCQNIIRENLYIFFSLDSDRTRRAINQIDSEVRVLSNEIAETYYRHFE